MFRNDENFDTMYKEEWLRRNGKQCPLRILFCVVGLCLGIGFAIAAIIKHSTVFGVVGLVFIVMSIPFMIWWINIYKKYKKILRGEDIWASEKAEESYENYFGDESDEEDENGKSE